MLNYLSWSINPLVIHDYGLFFGGKMQLWVVDETFGGRLDHINIQRDTSIWLTCALDRSLSSLICVSP